MENSRADLDESENKEVRKTDFIAIALAVLGSVLSFASLWIYLIFDYYGHPLQGFWTDSYHDWANTMGLILILFGVVSNIVNWIIVSFVIKRSRLGKKGKGDYFSKGWAIVNLSLNVLATTAFLFYVIPLLILIFT